MSRNRDLILAIETSNPSAWTPVCPARPGVAVGRRRADGGIELLHTVEIDPARPHDDTLMSAVDAAVRRAGATPGHLETVSVSVGPGGFTAVRLAVTAAKMIGEATGAACIGVPSASVAARRVRSGGRPFAVLLASKGLTAFGTIFSPEARQTHPGAIVDAAGIAALGVELIIADAYLPEPIRAAALNLGIPVDAPSFDPAACLEICGEFPPIDPSMLAPLYPREPEAVTKWRTLHPGSGGGRAA